MKVEIQKFTEQEEWIYLKSIQGENAWDDAVKNVHILNKEKNGKYRAVLRNGFLTHIQCILHCSNYRVAS